MSKFTFSGAAAGKKAHDLPSVSFAILEDGVPVGEVSVFLIKQKGRSKRNDFVVGHHVSYFKQARDS